MHGGGAFPGGAPLPLEFPLPLPLPLELPWSGIRTSAKQGTMSVRGCATLSGGALQGGLEAAPDGCAALTAVDGCAALPAVDGCAALVGGQGVPAGQLSGIGDALRKTVCGGQLSGIFDKMLCDKVSPVARASEIPTAASGAGEISTGATGGS